MDQLFCFWREVYDINKSEMWVYQLDFSLIFDVYCARSILSCFIFIKT